MGTRENQKKGIAFMTNVMTEISEDFKTINLNEIYGRIRAGYIEVSLITHVLDPCNAIQYDKPLTNAGTIHKVIEGRLILDPIIAKSLHKWLGSRIERYEEVFGVIPEFEDGKTEDTR